MIRTSTAFIVIGASMAVGENFFSLPEETMFRIIVITILLFISTMIEETLNEASNDE